ncbi:hypothetical protein D915_004445 [Fasciola hepatica]|uniref:Uncharacterized protein n=1 Tax=Fasciola hepatica TaxID=6192 RepID=A0A2H1CDL1_FASHE|nr:hypothetical protein D915_004445 [Fasciola hepatica]
MDQISNKNNATGSSVLPGAATVWCELTEMSVANDPKTSPSVRFPGWGVITDDEEEDDKKPQPTLAENKCSELTDKHVIENNRQSTEEKKLDENSNDEKANITSNIKPMNVKFEEPGMKTPKVPTTDLDKQRFRDLQEYFRRRESATISLAKSAAVLRQPRKSLAMIFSNLSTNLGFTNSSVRSKTGSLGSTSSSDSTHPQPTTSNLPQKIDGSFIDLSGSKLIRDQRGHSTIIQLSRDQSVDHAMSYMNGDIGRRGRVSLLNTVLPTHGRPGTDAITPALTRDHSRNHLGPDTTTDRSLFVDLLCCTCCTQVDEEADYSTLIENHRLARFITMAAILTILGLILAYIIRSAIEAPLQTIQVGTQTSTPTSPITNGNQARVPFVELSSWTQSSSSSSIASRVVISTASSIHVNITSTTPPYI